MEPICKQPKEFFFIFVIEVTNIYFFYSFICCIQQESIKMGTNFSIIKYIFSNNDASIRKLKHGGSQRIGSNKDNSFTFHDAAGRNFFV